MIFRGFFPRAMAPPRIRITLPIVAFLGLVFVSSASTPNATGAVHCNNKICSAATKRCQNQNGGPDTHCLDKDSVLPFLKKCVWDVCTPH